MLRKLLQEMTEVEDVAQHPALLVEVTANWPNTIVLLDSPYPLGRYTCAMHVFDFAEKLEYVAIAERGFGRIFAGGAFVQGLVDKGLLDEVAPTEVCEGDIVMYFNDESRFKHAGLSLGNNRVISKWGTGHLYEHGLLEVPESYGTRVKFFGKLPYDAAVQHFKHFAKENGIFLEEDPYGNLLKAGTEYGV